MTGATAGGPERTERVDLTDRTVLVVGGAGYVGSVLVSRLLASGARVRVLDQLIYDNGFALAHLLDDPGLTFVHGDLRVDEDVKRAAEGATDVVLLAALVGDPVCRKYPELAYEVNQEGAKNLVERVEALGVQRVVFTSTCSNYGIHDRAALATEDSVLNPQSLYAQTKISVEEYLLSQTRDAGICTTVLRIATAYGLSPRMRFDLTVSQFAWDLASGLELTVYDADTWRPYCHVRDIAKAIITVLSSPESLIRTEVFNVGDTAEQFTKRMIVDNVRSVVPDTAVVFREGDTDPRDYQVSFQKITEKLGFRCDHTVADYLAVLAPAVRAGFYPDGGKDPRYGNHEVRHLQTAGERRIGG
jgi:nucleoside-diphosphate-sugar epimerase